MPMVFPMGIIPQKIYINAQSNLGPRYSVLRVPTVKFAFVSPVLVKVNARRVDRQPLVGMCSAVGLSKGQCSVHQP
jgi:hypothetical protein